MGARGQCQALSLWGLAVPNITMPTERTRFGHTQGSVGKMLPNSEALGWGSPSPMGEGSHRIGTGTLALLVPGSGEQTLSQTQWLLPDSPEGLLLQMCLAAPGNTSPPGVCQELSLSRLFGALLGLHTTPGSAHHLFPALLNAPWGSPTNKPELPRVPTNKPPSSAWS